MARPRRPIASVINASLTALALVGLFVVQAYFVGGAVGLLPAAHAEMPAFAAADVPDGPIMVDYCSEAVAARDPATRRAAVHERRAGRRLVRRRLPPLPSRHRHELRGAQRRMQRGIALLLRQRRPHPLRRAGPERARVLPGAHRLLRAAQRRARPAGRACQRLARRGRLHVRQPPARYRTPRRRLCRRRRCRRLLLGRPGGGQRGRDPRVRGHTRKLRRGMGQQLQPAGRGIARRRPPRVQDGRAGGGAGARALLGRDRRRTRRARASS